MSVTEDARAIGDLEALRQEAEAALAAGRFDLAERLLARGTVSIAELIHDLRVHQVELELQAEELRDSNDRLEQAAGRYRKLFEGLPQPALVVDRLGTILEANQAAQRTFALDRRRSMRQPTLRALVDGASGRQRLTAVLVEAERTGRAQAVGLRLRAASNERLVDLYLERLDEPSPEGEERLVAMLVDETERVRAGTELAAIVDTAMDAIVMADADAIVTRFNRAAAEMFRVPAAEAIGSHLERFLPETADVALRTMSVDPVRHGRRGDGETFPLEGSISRLDDGDRTILTMVERDVTERQRTAEALIESEHRLREITEAMSEVFWLRDIASDRLLYVSPAYESIWGRSVASLEARPDQWLETIHPTDRETVLAVLTARNEIGFDLTYRIQRPDGEVRWVNDRAFPVRAEDGITRHVAGIARDVTQERAREERLRLLEQTVAQLNDLVLVVKTAPPDAPEPRIVFANDAFLRHTGYEWEDIAGRSPCILEGPETDPAQSDRVRAALARLEPVRLEVVHYTKAGRSYRVELDAAPITDATGACTHVVLVQRDVTDRKRGEERLKRA